MENESCIIIIKCIQQSRAGEGGRLIKNATAAWGSVWVKMGGGEEVDDCSFLGEHERTTLPPVGRNTDPTEH